MPRKKPPYSHREIARAMFSSSDNQYRYIPTWLKVEAYNLFMTVLPHLIALLVWAGIIGIIYLLIPS